MDKKQLRYYVSVVENGGFSKAAEKEFVTQATISYNISTLEKELDLLLIDRSEKNFTLTAAGIEYFNWAKKILNEIQIAEYNARNAQFEEDSSIRLGFFARSCYHKLPEILRHLREKDREIHIELVQENRGTLLRMLDNDELDGIFINDFGSINPFGLITKKSLYDDSVCLLLSADHCLAQKESIALKDLSNERILLLLEPDIEGLLDELPFPKSNVQAVYHAEELVLLVRSGYGVAFVNKLPFTNFPNDLALREVEDYSASDNIYFYWKKNNRKKSLKNLINILNCTNWQVR